MFGLIATVVPETSETAEGDSLGSPGFSSSGKYIKKAKATADAEMQKGQGLTRHAWKAANHVFLRTTD